VRASFVRCFASILYTYRRYLIPAVGDRKKSGMHYQFKMDEFMKNQPGENVQYLTTLQQTQGMSSLTVDSMVTDQSSFQRIYSRT
jgi:hypothetical protein